MLYKLLEIPDYVLRKLDKKLESDLSAIAYDIKVLYGVEIKARPDLEKKLDTFVSQNIHLIRNV